MANPWERFEYLTGICQMDALFGVAALLVAVHLLRAVCRWIFPRREF